MKTYQLNMTLSVDESSTEEVVLNKLIEFAENNNYLIGGGLQEFKDEWKPDPILIDSMATRFRHDFGLLSEKEKQSIRTTMTQLWEEVVGIGFYDPGKII